MGQLVPIEIVVTYPASEQSPLAQRISQVSDLQSIVAEATEVSGTFSALQMLPDAAITQTAVPRADWTAGISKNPTTPLASALEACRQAGLVKSDESGQHWRVSAYVSALGNMDYGRFLDELRLRVKAKSTLPADVQVAYTGIMPLVHDIQHQLMRDLLVSFLGALLLIYVVMSFTQAGLGAGLVAMLPNVFPIVVLFGLLGWANVPLDIGTVMTAELGVGRGG